MKREIVGFGTAREARVVGDALYVVRPAGAARDTVSRLSLPTGEVERSREFESVVGWGLSEAGVLIAEGAGGRVRLHALDPYLGNLCSRLVTGDRPPDVVVDGRSAWATFRTASTRTQHPQSDLGGWDGIEVYSTILSLTTGSIVRTDLGEAHAWYLEERGTSRRLLDGGMPSSIPPTRVGDGKGLCLVQGHYAPPATWFGGRTRDPRPFSRQTAIGLRADGAQTPLASLQAESATDWLAQLLVDRHGRWFAATSSGLVAFDGDLTGKRNQIVSRPSEGAARWVACNDTMFALLVDSVLPQRGVSLHVLDGSRLRELGRWPGMLGNLASVRAEERPRLVAGDGRLLLGLHDGTGRSILVRADEHQAEVVAEQPGWCEPVGETGDGRVVLLSREQAAGDAGSRPGTVYVSAP